MRYLLVHKIKWHYAILVSIYWTYFCFFLKKIGRWLIYTIWITMSRQPSNFWSFQNILLYSSSIISTDSELALVNPSEVDFTFRICSFFWALRIIPVHNLMLKYARPNTNISVNKVHVNLLTIHPLPLFLY